MRLAVSVLAIVSILLSALALGFIVGFGGLSDTDPRFGLEILVGGLGILVGFATFIVGLIAIAMRRQFVWLIGLIVAGLISVAAPGVVASLVNPSQVSGVQALVSSPDTIFDAGPLLIGVVVLIYSLRSARDRPDAEYRAVYVSCRHTSATAQSPGWRSWLSAGHWASGTIPQLPSAPSPSPRIAAHLASIRYTQHMPPSASAR